MKKNIAFIISNLASGGAQRAISNLSFELSNYYNLYIIVHDGSMVNYPYKGTLLDLNTPVRKNYFAKIYNFIVRISKLRSFKKKQLADVFISFLESSNAVNIFSGESQKTILSVRNYKSKQVKTYIGKIYRLFIKSFYQKSSSIVAVSEGVKKDLVVNFNIREDFIKVIYNPIDYKYITKASMEKIDQKYDELFEKPILITAGKLKPQKGHWHLIRAFSLIKEQIPEMKLIILGEGPLRGYLSGLVEEMELADEVIMPGFQVNPFNFLARATIFILPSLYEGFPNILLEAMACGLPVIAADCPSGPREILAPKHSCMLQKGVIEKADKGILIPVCDGIMRGKEEDITFEERMMAEAVVNLYKDKALLDYYKEESKNRGVDFSVEKIAKVWNKLIEHN